MVLLKTPIFIVLCFCDCICKRTNLTEFVDQTLSNQNTSVEALQQIKNLSSTDIRKKSIDLIGPFDFSRSSKAKTKSLEQDNRGKAEKLNLNIKNSLSATNLSKHANRTTEIVDIQLRNLSGANITLKLDDTVTSTFSQNNKNKTSKNIVESDNRTDHNVLISLQSTICTNLTTSNSIKNNCSRKNMISVDDFEKNTTKETQSIFLINEKTNIFKKQIIENEIIIFAQNNITESSKEDFYVTDANVFDLNVYVNSPSNNRLYDNMFRRPKNKTVIVNGTESTWPVKHAAILEGDLVLGGLMMVHSREDSVTCGPVMPQGGVQALEAMLYTLDVINSNKLLPGITLGAHVLDDCDTDTYGLEIAVDFIKARSFDFEVSVILKDNLKQISSKM